MGKRQFRAQSPHHKFYGFCRALRGGSGGQNNVASVYLQIVEVAIVAVVVDNVALLGREHRVDLKIVYNGARINLT